MKHYVLDANAAIRYLMKGPGIEKLDPLFVRAQRREILMSISVVNRGEILYTLAKRVGTSAAKEALRTLSRYVEPVNVSEEDADSAATLKFHYKMGYADCFAAELAMRMGATLVTADPEFVKLGKPLRILALPRHSA